MIVEHANSFHFLNRHLLLCSKGLFHPKPKTFALVKLQYVTIV